ncbi:MAG: sulfite exporter TauE/SafE family protein, partial [Desulfobacterales bacterium]|nr:sulfite exporter TauE/SafE family protein [Desulfobacterales bacterium]
SAVSNLYISMVFILILTVVSISILRDAFSSNEGEGGPSMKIVNLISKYNIPPYIHFKVADVTVSLWVIMVAGLATGYLAGTIGVGGFIGVPAMIYLFGVPTAVAAGSELYLAMFMGGWGALNYAFQGFVDIRLTMLLYLGSLIGIYIGAYGVKVVNEIMIRIITGLIILLCVISRAIAVPMYLRQLGVVSMDADWDKYLNNASKWMLFAAGISGTLVILFNVIKGYRQRRNIQTMLIKSEEVSVAA